MTRSDSTHFHCWLMEGAGVVLWQPTAARVITTSKREKGFILPFSPLTTKTSQTLPREKAIGRKPYFSYFDPLHGQKTAKRLAIYHLPLRDRDGGGHFRDHRCRCKPQWYRRLERDRRHYFFSIPCSGCYT